AALPLTVFLVGLLMVGGAFLRVTELVQYVSRSVVAGYITAAAFYIILKQLQKVLGFVVERSTDTTVFHDLTETIRLLPASHLPTVILSGATALFYFGMRRAFPRLPNIALTLVLFSGAGFFLNQWGSTHGWAPISTLDAVAIGEWRLTVPPLSRELGEKVALLALVIAFLGTLEASSIGKTLAARAGSRIDVNQEMFGLGLANMACALGQGVPASGSLTRSQLNFTAGATTAFASLFSGFFMLGFAALLGRFTAYIPECVLGVLIIAVGLALINGHVLRVVWTATRSDRVVFLLTFAAALLLRLDLAIVAGVSLSVLLFLRKAAQPELTEYTPEGELKPEDDSSDEAEISVVHVEGDLFFGAAEIFREQMRRACARPNLKVIILKMRNAHHLDATSILALEDLIRSLRQNERHFLISEVRPAALRIFENSGLLEVAGEENVFADDTGNPTLSTAKAMRRAMKLLEGQKAEVKIFLGGSHKETED
ncbi:MAG: SulP family inorganic anion transporter, partial [Verrucomicrobiota bacterium]